MNETEKEVLRALEKVKTFCKNHGENCFRCPFLILERCELMKTPEHWSIPDIAESMKQKEVK